MPTVMLPGSVSVTKFQPLLGSSSKPFIFTSSSSLHCSKSLSLKHKQRYSNRTLGSVSSRHSSGWPRDAYEDDDSIGLLPQASTSEACDVPELGPFFCESCKNISGAMRILNGVGDTCHDHISSSNSTHASFRGEEFATSLISSLRWLKFPVLLCLPTFLDSQQAIAGSDLATGMQSFPYFGDLGDISTGFASAFLLIFFSELGDKTFFIAAILAARNSGAVIFIGTFGALAAMTVVSVALGRTFHYVDDILPFRFGETDLPLDDIAAVCLLIYFGVSTLIEAASSDGQKTEEEQKEAEIAVSEFSGNGVGLLAAANTVFSTFLVVFVAEWGDKSFFSTIALAAASSPLGVIGGALAGHAVATLLAVLGGSLLGTFLSEKAVAYVGGTLFLVFAAVTLFEIVT